MSESVSHYTCEDNAFSTQFKGLRWPLDWLEQLPECLAASARRERDRQVSLVRAVGERLDALVQKPLVGRTLKLMGKPARLAGLSGLQDFLERGYEAFSEMRGAAEFLATFERREGDLLDRIYGA